jgi:hypothetical protein
MLEALTVEELSRKNITLVEADGVLKFLFSSLKKNESAVSDALLKPLKFYFEKRNDQ